MNLYGPLNESTDGLMFEMAYFGLAYYTELELEDDNRKICHYVRCDGTGELYSVGYSPYNKMTQDDLFNLSQTIYA